MATKPQQTAQETGAAFSLDTAAVLAEEEHGRRSRGAAPGTWPGGGCAGTTSRSPSSSSSSSSSPPASLAPLYAHHVAHTGPNDNHITDNVKVGGEHEARHLAGRHVRRSEDARASRQGRHDPRPDLVARRREVRARRGRQRPRRRGPAALRRPQLAQGRHRLGAHLHVRSRSSSRCSPATTAARPTGSSRASST